MAADKFLEPLGIAMPRIITDHERPRSHDVELVSELADELRADRLFGQPVIREQRFPKTNAIRITVIWDKWEPLVDEDRVAIILDAYQQVEGNEFRDRVALAIGLTVPEAHEAGLLPVQITTALRENDPVTIEQCREVLIELGASILSNPDCPILRFATVDEAKRCIKELVERLPGSDPVWIVTQDSARRLE